MTLSRYKPSEVIRFLYLCGLAVMLISLPIFNVGMSVATIWLGCNTVLYFMAEKWLFKNEEFHTRNPFKNRIAWLLISLYFLHLIGLIHTEDFNYAWRDLRIKIPILTIPFMLAYLPKINYRESKVLLVLFLAAITFSILSCLLVYWDLTHIEYTDVRKITVQFITRISHIRLSLIIIMGLAALYYSWRKFEFSILWLLSLGALFVYFLLVVQSVTGWFILLGLTGCLSVFYLLKLKSKQVRQTLFISAFSGSLLIAGLFYNYISNYFQAVDDIENLETHSANGEPYLHNTNNLQLQNNHYIWIYLAPQELERAWSERSDLPISATDRNNHALRATAIRYLTSKGLRKDAVGVRSLTDEDVKNIEKGITDYNYPTKSSLERRLDAVLFEFDNQRNGGNPSGNSVVQRFEYWRAALSLIEKNPWTGVGTGDVQLEFQDFYSSSQSKLQPKYRLRAHNQYLTFGVCFGILGGLWFIFVLIYSFFYQKNYNQFLFFCFFIISVLSFVGEDTLETQAGVTFFAFFFSFFLFQWPAEESNKSVSIRK